MGTSRWTCTLGFWTILSTPASACFCFSTPMCAQTGRPSDSNAVFVGQVTEVWPTREMIANESRRLTLPKWKRLILERWHDRFSVAEERYIRTTTDRGLIELRFGNIQRVRFVVSEFLAGPQVGEVYTNTSSCGYHFDPGLTYLVNAIPDGPRLRTGACFRSSRIESDEAVEDLKALQARRTGNTLSPRIYGRISLRALRPDTLVRLVDDQDREERSVRPDANGRFSFDALTKATHRLQVEDSRGKGESLVDLSRFDCFEAFSSFSEAWSIGGMPVTLESKEVPIILEPPPVLLPGNQ